MLRALLWLQQVLQQVLQTRSAAKMDASRKLDLVTLLQSDPAVLKHFLDALGDALFAVDRDKNIVFWNRQAEKLTGFSAAEVLGRHCLAGIRCANCLSECGLFEHGRLEGVRVALLTKDGRRLTVSKHATVLRDAAGETVGGVEWLRDETELVDGIERCRAQGAEIAGRERLQAAVLGSIREGVLTIDSDWRITSFSRRAEALTGIAADDAVGRFCHEVIGSRLCRSDCPARHCLETGAAEAVRTTELADAAGGQLPVAESAVPLRDAGGRALGSVLLIEDRRAAAEQLAAARDGARFAGMVGRSEPMQRVFRVIEQVAASDVTVLIQGASGTGKERVARALHARSPRRAGPFEAINCAALPEALLESELFGHAKGAFTGALRDRPGRIEAAAGGTLLLDEVAETTPAIQAKLLRFLQDRQFQRVGENRTRFADVRLVAATNRDLEQAVAEGALREDLYYRLRVIPIQLPPLSQRREDVPLLAAHLLAEIAAARGRPELSLSAAAVQRLVQHDWPGNVRELINAIEYAVALAPGRRIRPEDLPPELAGSRRRYSARGEAGGDERQRILEALERHGNNRTRSAEALGMNRVTLYRKMKRYGIS
jgi:PAS domain S-box-containing protein